ncbi:hypothetical protein SKAU_G00094520 [Synaphobranchus kaupii]|uniref:Uncharacterized protein n=1 Tax=Synaphobranchus kaupii TaxID=118154 RepID=A0A9Q1J6I3_SYNKA|nr:hypothetical protein SKAU_G00094520 [Synaphobranchus kaupii]
MAASIQFYLVQAPPIILLLITIFKRQDVPKQFASLDCGVLMIMYALYISMGQPFDFTQSDMPQIRRWWCLHLLGEAERFYNLVTSERFRRKAHFLWLDSVVTWRRFSSTYQQDFRRMYVLETCRQCKEVYKNCIPGYVGRGRRGELQAFYSDDSHPAFAAIFVNFVQGWGSE